MWTLKCQAVKYTLANLYIQNIMLLYLTHTFISYKQGFEKFISYACDTGTH